VVNGQSRLIRYSPDIFDLKMVGEQSLAGSIVWLREGQIRLDLSLDRALHTLSSRTALLMPCHNEAPVRVTARLVGHCLISLRHWGRPGSLMAPVTMLSQSANVPDIVLGRDAGWHAQRRDDGSIPTAGIIRAYVWHTFFGGILGFAAWFVSPALLLWMSPVILGLVLSIPLVIGTARGWPKGNLSRTP
jgi:membrane glycosyltransferase